MKLSKINYNRRVASKEKRKKAHVMGKRVTLKVARERLAGRTDLVIIEFVSWKKKAKFFDKISKDYFWSIPADVLRHDIVHPDRRMAKKKQTNLKNWGVEHPTQSKKIKEKTKTTNLKKYGKEHYLQTEDKKKKTKATNMKKYGVVHHMKSVKGKKALKEAVQKKYGVDNVQKNKNIKKKTVATLKRRYGAENPSQVTEFKEKKKRTSLLNWGVEEPLASPEIRKKAKATILKKYGAEHPMHSQEIKEKLVATNLKRYGVEHWSKTKMFKRQMNQKIVIETGQWVKEWLDQQSEPKPSYITVVQHFTGQQEVAVAELEQCLLSFRDAKTSLEKFSEKLFEAPHYNKKPKQIDATYKPDFRLSPRTFLNVDGLYWHSEKQQKDKRYHFKLREEFEKAGLRIFQFREDEIRNKTVIVKSITNNALGKISKKIGARKCVLKKVPQEKATKFLNENHLMGTTNAKHVGLFYEDELVCLLSWKCRKNICKIERFCSKTNTIVNGGFTKLLSAVENIYLSKDITEIHNWVDLRYGTGSHLQNKNFILARETLGWKWTDGKNRFNRLRCRANMDKRGLTQQEYADELNWYKIFDAGQRLYVKNRNKIRKSD